MRYEMRYECEECFGKEQKPCIVIIPGNHEFEGRWGRWRCLVTPNIKRAAFKFVEETI